MFSLSGCRGRFCDVWFCAWGSWSGCGCGVGCGWVVGWCDCWFCGSRDKDANKLVCVLFDGRPRKVFGPCCFIKFAWREDLVENRFVYVDTEKYANEINDGYRQVVHVDVEDREVR